MLYVRAAFSGRWLDGRSAVPRAVRFAIGAGELVIDPDDGVARQVPRPDALRIAVRRRSAPRHACSTARHLGLVEAMDPHARIVHTRRDPLDNRLSVYFLHLAATMPWARDLLDVAPGTASRRG